MDIPMAAIRRARDSLELTLARMEVSRAFSTDLDRAVQTQVMEFWEAQISRDKAVLDELDAWLEEEAKR